MTKKRNDYESVIKSYSINEDLFNDVKQIAKLKNDMISKLIQQMFAEYLRDNEQFLN